MNTLKFEVYKNTLKRRDGFNPVLGEKKYTKIKCYFMESDWDNCALVTANFMSEKDNIVKSTVSLTTDDKTAVFDIPSELEGDKVYFSLTGSYAEDGGNTVTLNTNLVGINRQKGMLPSASTGISLFEKIIVAVNSMASRLKDTLNQFMNTYPNVDASNLTWLNVRSLGVDNTGADTTLGMLVFYPLDNRTLYFPKGTYKCNGLALENVENLTIICDNAEFIYCNKATDNTDSAGTSVQSTFFKFTGCKNLTVIDGNFDGKNKVSQIITLINCPNANIDNVNISNAGNALSATAAGINFLRNCSHFNVRNAKISGIKAGTVGPDGYIHSFGIGVTSAGNGYSQHGNIVNVRINDIDGYNSGDVKPDGDGIYLIERPTDDFSGDGYINISRCEIKGCAKRGIKVSTRHVNISDCYIDVDSWGSAIEAQYGKLTLRDSIIKNRYASCLTLGWDNGTNYIDNCKLYGAGKDESSKYGNYKGNGIVLNQRLSSRDEPYSDEPCNISINNCFVDGVFSPIISGYDNNIKYKYGNIVVDNLKIGHYRDASAIKLNSTMMTDVNRLVLSDIMYQYGTTEAEVLNANNEYYALSNTAGTTINLGTLSSYVNPKRLVYDTNLTDDYNEIFKFYNLNNADFGGETAKVTDVLEDSPNSADIADGTYTSVTNTNLSVSVADGTMNVACSTAYASASYVYIPISSITLDGNVFDFVVSDISKTTADVTLTLANAKKATIAGLTEFALNKTVKSTIVGNVSGTASFVRIKLNANKTASLSCKVNFKNRQKVLKGQVEARLKILEEKIKTLEGANA